LAEGDASAGEVGKPFDMTPAAISKHLKVLETAGLITRSRDAQRRPCRIEGRPLADIDGWLEGYRHFWQESFARLDDLLVEMQSNQGASNDKRKKKKESR
jgi:DNA-binding transcriptional ArsR family regulator